MVSQSTFHLHHLLEKLGESGRLAWVLTVGDGDSLHALSELGGLSLVSTNAQIGCYSSHFLERNWGSERLSNFSSVPQQVAELEVKPRCAWLQSLYVFQPLRGKSCSPNTLHIIPLTLIVDLNFHSMYLHLVSSSKQRQCFTHLCTLSTQLAWIGALTQRHVPTIGWNPWWTQPLALKGQNWVCPLHTLLPPFQSTRSLWSPGSVASKPAP